VKLPQHARLRDRFAEGVFTLVHDQEIDISRRFHLGCLTQCQPKCPLSHAMECPLSPTLRSGGRYEKSKVSANQKGAEAFESRHCETVSRSPGVARGSPPGRNKIRHPHAQPKGRHAVRAAFALMRARLFHALYLFMVVIAMFGWTWLIFDGLEWLVS
jgi:hypothetical protein